MTDATNDIDYGYDGESEEIELTEDETKLLEKLDSIKDLRIDLRLYSEDISSITIKEIIEITKLMIRIGDITND
jgi:hypothetical protein